MITELPILVLETIFEFLNMQEIGILEQTCNSMKSIIKHLIIDKMNLSLPKSLYIPNLNYEKCVLMVMFGIF
jgi:hypothetical protein